MGGLREGLRALFSGKALPDTSRSSTQKGGREKGWGRYFTFPAAVGLGKKVTLTLNFD